MRQAASGASSLVSMTIATRASAAFRVRTWLRSSCRHFSCLGTAAARLTSARLPRAKAAPSPPTLPRCSASSATRIVITVLARLHEDPVARVGRVRAARTEARGEPPTPGRGAAVGAASSLETRPRVVWDLARERRKNRRVDYRYFLLSERCTPRQSRTGQHGTGCATSKHHADTLGSRNVTVAPTHREATPVAASKRR